jgi:hypothetical protein
MTGNTLCSVPHSNILLLFKDEESEEVRREARGEK